MTGILNLRFLIIAAILVATFTLLASTTFAKPQEGERPGWGFGDQNHTHTGPPGGPSVHPVK